MPVAESECDRGGERKCGRCCGVPSAWSCIRLRVCVGGASFRRPSEHGMMREYLRRGYRESDQVLYSRANFKLFLKMSLADVDFRVQQLAAAADYFSSSIRPIPILAPFGRSMLVVAPHQDDEVIGPGGALALQVRAHGAASVMCSYFRTVGMNMTNWE